MAAAQEHVIELQGDRMPPGLRRALLVEDAPLNRQLAKALLECGPFCVSVASNGAEAVEAVRHEQAFDIVLMDLDMPVMDGFEAATAIRELGAGRGSVPIIALSAFMPRDIAERARAAGMNGHLAKPYNPSTFVHKIEGWIEAAARAHDSPADTGDSGRLVWNREVFDQIAARLGSARMEQGLLLFEAQLARTRNILQSPALTMAQLTFEAHALVSSAGTLGFADLCYVSDKAQRLGNPPSPASGMEGPDARPAADDLLRAVENAVLQVRRRAAPGPAKLDRHLPGVGRA